jgi:septal ring factor EnvC (AmiA/AmiB activator)
MRQSNQNSPHLEAIRFVSGLVKPHSATTESRLALVIGTLAKLADDTDADTSRRIARLRAEQERIEREITTIEQGASQVASEAAALERTREVITLADNLAGDFRTH